MPPGEDQAASESPTVPAAPVDPLEALAYEVNPAHRRGWRNPTPADLSLRVIASVIDFGVAGVLVISIFGIFLLSGIQGSRPAGIATLLFLIWLSPSMDLWMKGSLGKHGMSLRIRDFHGRPPKPSKLWIRLVTRRLFLITISVHFGSTLFTDLFDADDVSAALTSITPLLICGAMFFQLVSILFATGGRRLMLHDTLSGTAIFDQADLTLRTALGEMPETEAGHAFAVLRAKPVALADEVVERTP